MSKHDAWADFMVKAGTEYDMYTDQMTYQISIAVNKLRYTAIVPISGEIDAAAAEARRAIMSLLEHTIFPEPL